MKLLSFAVNNQKQRSFQNLSNTKKNVTVVLTAWDLLSDELANISM